MKKLNGRDQSLVLVMTILFLIALIVSFFAFFIGYMAPSLQIKQTASATDLPVQEIPLKIPEPPPPLPQAEALPEQKPEPEQEFKTETVTEPVFYPQAPESERAVFVDPPSKQQVAQGTLIVVIDDAGNNLTDIEPFLRFPGRLTISVLPGLPHSAEVARRVRAAGKEVFLHQPMEAIGGQNPGPGALYTGMTSAEVRQILEQNLRELWPVAGINNHEGSKITQDESIMETVLEVCREWGIVFLDSRTIATSVVPALARREGMDIAERDIFLDNSSDREYILNQLKEGMRKANRTGSVIMIGHTRTKALAALLNEFYSNLVDDGYQFSIINSR
ncbi:MAG: divergent polysaccharide deacetylase family protein [Spirochaetaceae bacterium]|jgi:polysaccharide deacetylase 2 family uncharacterized protein YibQ|nr:divergent polysaccharide deacetylase family protein [Spirochaetaceae bacterium]